MGKKSFKSSLAFLALTLEREREPLQSNSPSRVVVFHGHKT